MTHGAATALGGLLYSAMEQAEIEWAIKLGDLDAAEAKIDIVNARFELIESAIKDTLAQMSVRDISRELTSLGTEFYLQSKLLGAVGEFFEFAQKQLPKIAEGVLGLIQDERALLSTAEGVQVYIADEALSVAEQMQLQTVDKVVGSAQKVMTAEQTFLTQVVKDMLGGLKKELPAIRSMFDSKRKGFAEFANKYLKIDYEHILGLELNYTRRGMPKIGGLHHDFMNVIEKSGALEFANKIMHSDNFYKVEARYLGNKVKDITFFPAHWSREQVVNTIYEAYDNFIKSGAKGFLDADGKYIIKGITRNGVEIEMYITQKGKMTSAYPILK